MNMRNRKLLIVLFALACQAQLFGQDSTHRSKALDMFNNIKDSASGNVDSLMNLTNQSNIVNELAGSNPNRAKVDTNIINRLDYVSLQQMVKGNAVGVFVAEPNGEPGSEQYMFVHGLKGPMLSKKDLYEQQPVVFLNGVPLIQNSTMPLDIQSTDFNMVGPATNLLATLNPNDIESIEVLKDPATLAKLGPIAANGAIWIKTKSAKSGAKQISIDGYFGMTQSPKVTPVNAAYENAFRQPFYDKYASAADLINYPVYLKDSTDQEYYGTADWTDLYFKNKPFYAVNMSLTGGSERANFRFQVNNTRSVSGQDGAALDRYGLAFFINMSPLTWLTVSSMINANRLDRDRNRNIRDRLAEIRYTPDLSNPLPPSYNVYSQYIHEFDEAIDDNKVNSLQGYFSVGAKISGFSFLSKLSVDYNESLRDAFWPSELLSGNNFVSYYFGYNQRLMVSNTASYEFKLDDVNKIDFEAGQSYQADINKYDYAFGYNTPNDFIKFRTTKTNDAGDYVSIFNMQYFPFFGKLNQRLASFYGQVNYSYKDYLKLTGVLRRDGSSNVQQDQRWISSPIVNLSWDVLKSVMQKSKVLNNFELRASYGTFGSLFNTDIYSKGPRYVTDASWPADPAIGSYVGIAASSRPYTSGWAGYGIGWQKSEKMNLGADLGFMQNRLQFSLDLYNENNKNRLLPVPVPQELGYTVAYKSGMTVNNKGVDLSVRGRIFTSEKQDRFAWTTNFNLSLNKNKITALPDGLQSVVIGDQKFEVGQSADAFWVYKNEGIYTDLAQIPVSNQTGLRQSFNGLLLNSGDPEWADLNGDNDISIADKVLTGHYLPTVTGGFGNDFNYEGFSLSFQFYFALGQKLLNQQISNRLNFINTEGSRDLNTVKEITYWQKIFDASEYPMYNPWSNVVPYQVDQDLFLENASFIKLRSLTIGYDLTYGNNERRKKAFRSAQLYLSATNLFTISPFKHGDPELVDYQGYYRGYNQMLPKTYTIGLRIDL
ncbi:SusC/RagA family TonB-linked outer membrane protein [Arachidicoccus ginsenosidivorans]|nr:SusC/RagA family TonB-linked outer membrane protein [Arachidicoccus ginsenosidivorans]